MKLKRLSVIQTHLCLCKYPTNKTYCYKVQFITSWNRIAVIMSSNTNNTQALFACSKCFSRHPFEELSSGQQLCKVRIKFEFMITWYFFNWSAIYKSHEMYCKLCRNAEDHFLSWSALIVDRSFNRRCE